VTLEVQSKDDGATKTEKSTTIVVCNVVIYGTEVSTRGQAGGS
jgi:hypothetical protein